MPQGETLRVTGYRELLRACDRAGKDTRREVRGAFRKVGEVVRVEASRRFENYDARSAAGYRTRVRTRGVAVEQSLRKTTGQHPEFGPLQMDQALLPALDTTQREVVGEFEKATDKVVDHFNR